MSGAIAFAGSSAAAGDASTIIASALLASDLSFGSASAGIRYNPSGSYETISAGVSTNEGNWVSPSTAAAEWEIQATVASGFTPTGTIGSWVALSSTRSWTLSRSGTGLAESNLTFEFRRVGGSVAEFTVTGNILTAEVL